MLWRTFFLCEIDDDNIIIIYNTKYLKFNNNNNVNYVILMLRLIYLAPFSSKDKILLFSILKTSIFNQ